MEDGDKVQDEAQSLFFFISAWLDIKSFPWSGLLYVLLTNVDFKKWKKVVFLFFSWTKPIYVLEIMKCSKLKWKAEDFREKSMLDKYMTFK